MIFPENSTQKENKGGQTMDDRAILFRDLDLACITSDGVCIHPPSPVSDPDACHGARRSRFGAFNTPSSFLT